MRIRNIALVGIALLCGTAAFAQEPGKAEVAVNYSYIRGHANKAVVRPFNLNGAGGSVVYFFNDWIGIKGDLQGYGSTTQYYAGTCGTSACQLAVSGNLFTYTGGLEVKSRTTNWEPFGDLLFGGAHTNAIGNLYQAAGLTQATPDNNGFAMIVGGGIDYHFGGDSHFGLRLGEFDYLLTRLGNNIVGTNNQSSFRFQAGVVFHF
jgi:hypothetical protein